MALPRIMIQMFETNTIKGARTTSLTLYDEASADYYWSPCYEPVIENGFDLTNLGRFQPMREAPEGLKIEVMALREKLKSIGLLG